MYMDEPPKDGNIPDFNISKIDICPFRAYQRSFRLFHGNFSKGIHLRSRLLCFTQNDHTGQTGFKICPFLKWAHVLTNKSHTSSLQEIDRRMPRPILHHDTFLTEIFEPLLGGILGQAEKEAKSTSGDETILFQIFLDFLQKFLFRILGRLRSIFRTDEVHSSLHLIHER